MALPPAYSVNIARYNNVPSSGAFNVGPPPSGYKWVVVDMTLMSFGNPWEALDGVVIYDDDSSVIWAVTTPISVQGRFFHWQGRQVIEATQHLVIAAAEPGWALRISGYQLQVA